MDSEYCSTAPLSVTASPPEGQSQDTRTALHSNGVHRTTTVSAVSLGDSPPVPEVHHTVPRPRAALPPAPRGSQVTNVCRTPVEVLPDGVVMDGGRRGHEDVPDGVGKRNDAVALEEHHAQAVDRTAPRHLRQSFRVALPMKDELGMERRQGTFATQHGCPQQVWTPSCSYLNSAARIQQREAALRWMEAINPWHRWLFGSPAENTYHCGRLKLRFSQKQQSCTRTQTSHKREACVCNVNIRIPYHGRHYQSRRKSHGQIEEEFNDLIPKNGTEVTHFRWCTGIWPFISTLKKMYSISR